MVSMLAHLTPLEAPLVWLAFGAGIAAGVAVTWTVMRVRAAKRC